MSLLAVLRRAKEPLPTEQVPHELLDKIGMILRGYLISTSLADQHEQSEPIFAFQDSSLLSGLGEWDRWIPEDEHDTFLQVIAFRNRLAGECELQSQLERLVELPEDEQRLTLLFLNEAICSTHKYDGVIAAWLAQTERVVDAVQQLSGLSFVQALDFIAEFHQRQRTEWTTQLPHVLAYILEKTNDAERAQLLIGHIVLMSINGGIVSPIQRIAASKWRAEVAKLLPNWRDSIVELGRHSEPWVCARVRATSSAISRLFGPRHQQAANVDPISQAAP
ncbi:MAG: hypothetical protein KKA28_15755 [Planctomycetes bacterium]|nr:hypothetical protein [Planctomycetota bacterium]MCG2685296.1 hypothetical protein [Planctomycetales bacterium]